MKTKWFIRLGFMCAATACLCLPSQHAAQVDAAEPAAPSAEQRPTAYPLAVARDRAQVMHNVYAATLEVMHHRYFHGDRAIVPARAMEDVFSTIKGESNIEARWISVNMKPMSIEHEPKSDFEKKAARAIAAGKSEYAAVEEGYFRRAGPIPLADGCISCHGGFALAPSKTPKFAGLVISVPIQDADADESN